MHYLRYPAMAVGLLLTLLTPAALAAPLQVFDQQGEPLKDAVILVDEVAQRAPLSTSMDQIDLQFQPRVLVVPAGSAVDFPNGDDVRHHVYSFSPTKPFELRLFHGTEAPPVAFEQSGPVVLGCNIHDAMVGYILVTDSPWYAISAADGNIDLAYLPEGEVPVSWWHPSLGDQPAIELGSMNLHSRGPLTLPVDGAAEAAAEKTLSPLQQRFNKAAGKYAN